MERESNEDSFFLELERAAKSLSIGSDRTAVAELRRLFSDLQVEGREMIVSVMPEDSEKAA